MGASKPPQDSNFRGGSTCGFSLALHPLPSQYATDSAPVAAHPQLSLNITTIPTRTTSGELSLALPGPEPGVIVLWWGGWVTFPIQGPRQAHGSRSGPRLSTGQGSGLLLRW
jgi:hypothetical protein